jgi:predicted nucleic acid-binding protein
VSTIDYLESSALVKLVLDEREHEDLRRHLTAASGFTTSLLAVTEVGRSVRRVAPDSDGAIAATFRGVAVMDIDRRVIDHAARLGPATLRTLDAIHLASAMQLGPELRSFVTYDRRLAAAARDAGLPVASPGLPPD